MNLLEIVTKMYIPLVLVLCLCLGYLMKNFMPTDNKIIPTVLFIVGAICGVVYLGASFDAFVRGGVTGLASTGVHQLFKQLIENSKYGGNDKEFKMPNTADENKNINEEAIAEGLKNAEVLDNGNSRTNC